MTSLETLKTYFGYDSFRAGQEKIINSILSGESVVAILPTGAGKSICYQVPALMSNNYSIVISPLIALMKDQVDSLNKIKRTSAFINSSLDYPEVEKVLNELNKKEIKLLYVAPEKLENRNFVERLKSMSPEYLFVDEAHCISEWGHNFRPSYRRIKDIIELLDIKKVAAFTATATPEVRKDIIEQLALDNTKVFISGFERENLVLNVIHSHRKKDKLVSIINSNSLPAIIYTATRKQAEDVSSHLESRGIKAQHYHAGLSPELRRLIQDDFINNEIDVIAATNAFGMGIDKKDIRLIIHYNIPGSIENYYQEIGRAGRDGNESKIYLLFNERDIDVHEYFIESSYPNREQIEKVYKLICDYGKIAVGSSSDKEINIDQNLISIFSAGGINKSLLNSSIRLLREAGYFADDTSLFNKYYIRFLDSPDKLQKYLKNLRDESLIDLTLLLVREYGNKIFSEGIKADISFFIKQLQTNFSEINILFDKLASLGFVEYEKPTFTQKVKLNSTRIKAKNLQIDLNHTQKLKELAVERLNKMVEYVYTDKCRFNFILDYFGEDINSYRCGKCDNCTETTGEQESIEDYIEEKIFDLLEEFEEGIKQNDVLKILMGTANEIEFITSEVYSSCAHFEAGQIRDTIQKLINRHEINKTDDNKLTLLRDINNTEPVGDFEKHLELYNALREVRKEAAIKFNQSINIVCPDEVLKSIAEIKPATSSELLLVKGFNQRMYNKLGEDILRIVNEITKKNNDSAKLNDNKVPDSIKQIFELVKKRYSLADISSLTKLPEAVVSMQIESLISLFPELNIDSLVEYKKVDTIKEKIESGLTGLKELKSSLPNNISYAEIRIILAKEKHGLKKI